MNKLYFILLGVFTISITIASAADYDKIYEEANALYHKEAYSEAADQYESLIQEGVYSKEVFFNLGNTYYQLGEVALSVYNYERALLLAPNDEDITYNLRLAQLYLQDKIEVIPPFILHVWFKSLVNLFSTNTWVILAIIFIVLGFAGLLFSVLYQRSAFSKVAATIGFIALFLSGLFTYFAGKHYHYIFDNPYAIIGAPTTIVKGSPSENATDIVILHEGTKVELLNNYQGHSEIKISDGNVGWVMTDDLLPIGLGK